MGKFNLNQILNSASRQAAEGGDNPPRPTESEIKKISVFDLVPSEENFYSMREIEELKAAIEIAGKVLQNLVVVPLENGKYKVIAGHRRRLASIALVEDGKPQYEFVPCSVEPTEEAAEDQEIRDGLNLIVTNSQREKTAWDKIEEVRYLRDVLEKAKTRPRFAGLLRAIAERTFGGGEVQADGTRDFIAKVLHTSTTQIGRYDTIIRHLSPEFKAELKEDRINLSTAYELAGLPEDEQRAAFEDYKRTGEISIKAARERKRDAEAKDGDFHCRDFEECEYNGQDVCRLPQGEVCPHSARENTSSPPPPQAEQPPEEPEETAPPAEPVRERDEHTPPAAHCIPSTVPPPKIEWDEAPGAEHHADGPQNAQDGREPQAVKMDPERTKKPAEAAQGQAEAESQPKKETRCVGKGICPCCGEKFDAGQVTRYNTFGTQAVGPVHCPHCGKALKILCSVEYICSPAEE